MKRHEWRTTTNKRVRWIPYGDRKYAMVEDGRIFRFDRDTRQWFEVAVNLGGNSIPRARLYYKDPETGRTKESRRSILELMKETFGYREMNALKARVRSAHRQILKVPEGTPTRATAPKTLDEFEEIDLMKIIYGLED